MQAFLLIPEAEWQHVLDRLARLEAAEQQRAKEMAALPRDEVLNVRQAAALLKVTPGGLRRARRAGRVKGVRLNEKEWGSLRWAGETGENGVVTSRSHGKSPLLQTAAL